MTLVTDRDRGRGSQSRQKERGAQAGGPGATGEVSGLALSTRCKDARPSALSVHVRGRGGVSPQDPRVSPGSRHGKRWRVMPIRVLKISLKCPLQSQWGPV